MMTNHQSTLDNDLAERLTQGDPTALLEAHDAHQSAMFSAARAILRDRDAAFDITQDVLAHLWSHPGKYDPARGSLRTYLLARTRSRALDVLRSENARRRRERRDHAGQGRVTRSVEEVVVDRDLATRLHERLMLLVPREREVISLAYLEGLSYRQVAEHLSIPEGTAKSRIRSALRRLQLDPGGMAA